MVFQTSLPPCPLDESCLSIGRVKLISGLGVRGLLFAMGWPCTALAPETANAFGKVIKQTKIRQSSQSRYPLPNVRCLASGVGKSLNYYGNGYMVYSFFQHLADAGDTQSRYLIPALNMWAARA